MVLTDAELRAQLVAHGVSVGPLTDSTRSLYVKKLAKLDANSTPVVTKSTPAAKKASPKVKKTPRRQTPSRASTRHQSEDEGSGSPVRRRQPNVIKEPTAKSTPKKTVDSSTIIPGLRTSSRSGRPPTTTRRSMATSPMSAEFIYSDESSANDDEESCGEETVYVSPIISSTQRDLPPRIVSAASNSRFARNAANVVSPPISHSAAVVGSRPPMHYRTSYDPRAVLRPSKPIVSSGSEGSEYGDEVTSTKKKSFKLPKLPSINVTSMMSMVPWRFVGGGILVGVIAYTLAGNQTTTKRIAHVAYESMHDSAHILYTSIFVPLILLALTFSLCAALYYYIAYRRRQKAIVDAQVEEMLGKVTEAIKSRSMTHPHDPYVSVPHTRDAIIRPIDRTPALMAIWKRVEKIVNEEESRVSTELHLIDGRESQVWCWTSSTGMHDDEIVGGASTPDEDAETKMPPPFSACLKLRHAFDADDRTSRDSRWCASVEKRLLQECGVPTTNVVHVAVDRESTEGVVYVKGMSKHDAGRCYERTNGKFIGGASRCVAKYVTGERYAQRFPESAMARVPLRV